MIHLMSVLILAFGLNDGGHQASLKVRHDHDPWGECLGELIFSDTGIEFTGSKEKDNRKWRWQDIQSFDRMSSNRISILTYQDQTWRLGSDREYDFEVVPDTEPLSEETFQYISGRLGKALTDREARTIDPDYQVSAKHLHALGGCEGSLRFSQDLIVFESDQKGHGRTWTRARDVESVWSLNRYQFEIHAFEGNKRDFQQTRRFRFQLKEPLDKAYYEKLRREMVPDW